MRRPDKAQRKLTADYLEKFSLALATAVAAKIFFPKPSTKERKMQNRRRKRK